MAQVGTVTYRDYIYVVTSEMNCSYRVLGTEKEESDCGRSAFAHARAMVSIDQLRHEPDSRTSTE